MPSQDKVTVGVTAVGAAHLAAVMDTGWFATEMDAYRAAIAVALRGGVRSGDEDMAGVRTKFNVGSIDPDGSLGRMVATLLPEANEPPYALCERLADAGLRVLEERLVGAGALLSEVLGTLGTET